MADTSGGRPNLILVFSDQQHWQAMGAVDSFFHTPQMDAFAKDAVRFENVFCTTPQCSPSRSSMFTGQYPHKTGVKNNVGMIGGDPLNQTTVGKMLQNAGYYTAYFGKWHLGDEPVGNDGWDVFAAGKSDAQSVEASTAFLKSSCWGDKPLALVVSLIDPHDIYHFRKEPLDVPADVPLPVSWEQETFEGKPEVQRQFMAEDQGKVMAAFSREGWQRYHWFYRHKTALYDTLLGQVLDEVREQGLWEKSVTIVTSDHGDMDSQHRLIFKGPFMYEHMMRVPLLIRVPDAWRGRRSSVCDKHVVLTDLVPTLCDFGDAQAGETDGQSLRPLVCEGEPSTWQDRPFVIGEYHGKQKWVNPMRMIRTHAHKYIMSLSGDDELYDLQADPHELRNLVNDDSLTPVLNDLRSKLQDWMAKNDDPFVTLERTNRTGELVG